MRRREFVSLLGGAAAWPLSARAQQPDRIRRVSVLIGLAEDDPDSKPRLAAFQQGLEKLGWSEGRNIRLDVRFALPGNEQQLQMLVKELLALSPDVIVVQSTAPTAAFRRESRNVPIVFIAVGDPVGAGFIASLARPGSNLTGLTIYESSIAGKWLAMLKEIDPRITRVAFIINPRTSSFALSAREAETMARSLAIELAVTTIENAGDIGRVIESFASSPNGGLVFPPNATTTAHRDLVVALAARYRLPAVYAWREFVTAGGLMSYGIEFVEQFRQAASCRSHFARQLAHRASGGGADQIPNGPESQDCEGARPDRARGPVGGR
jgi:putative ABC transport system substrate-binding protein